MNTIILHGLGQTPEDWKTVREQLEKRNSKDTVFCPDMTEWIGKSQLCYDPFICRTGNILRTNRRNLSSCQSP